MYYSYYTYDRSGAQLLNILQNFYYCFKNNLEYCGPIKNKKYSSVKYYNQNISETKKLINFLNIPNIEDKKNNLINKYDINFNDNFLNLIQTQVKPNLKIIHDKIDDFIVCLHIRRGDVQKNNRWSFRYTDDEYYFELINEIKIHKPNSKIYLFSEKCFLKEQNYHKYIELGCILMLGTSLEQAFNYFIQCDIFIMASSAFSHVPALYKKNGLVIYTLSKYFKPLNHWIDSNDINIKKKSIKQFIEMKTFTCKNVI